MASQVYINHCVGESFFGLYKEGYSGLSDHIMELIIIIERYATGLSYLQDTSDWIFTNEGFFKTNSITFSHPSESCIKC